MHTRLRTVLVSALVLLGLTTVALRPALAAEPTLTGITLAPGVVNVTADQTATFTLTGTYSDATSKDVTELTTWTVNGAGFTGIPSQKGAFTAVAVGSWTVTATLGGLSASAAVTITHGAPVALTLMPTPATVKTDAVVLFRLFAQDADGNGREVTSQATWTTNDASGSVSAAGYAPKVAGTWQFTGTLGSLNVTRTIVVEPSGVTSLIVTPADLMTLDIGNTVQMQTTAQDADGNTVTPVVTWSVTNPDIGSISETGLFTAKQPGQTNVIALVGNVQSITPVYVRGEVVAETTDTPDIVAVAKPTPTSLTPRVEAESVEKETVAQSTGTPITPAPEAKADEKNLPHPWVIVLLLAHVISLAGYFSWLMRKGNRWWWLPPVVTTGILLAMYSWAFMEGTYTWWPWTVIGVSIIFISVYYQRYGPRDQDSPGSTASPPGPTYPQ